MSKQILIVEDDTDIRNVIAEFLSDEDYAVACSSKGKEALNLLSDQTFNLIILDMGLPDMTGNDFLRELEHYVAQAVNVSVVVVSANPRSLIPNPRVKSVIGKPFDLQDLLVTVGRYA